VDGEAGKAWFDVTDAEGNQQRVEKSFDFLHAVPPQRAPRFIRESVWLMRMVGSKCITTLCAIHVR